jgi:transcriptional regulator with XRE-family HTH domain
MTSVVIESEIPVAETNNAAPGVPADGKPLHRIASVRRRQGVALRTAARVLNVDVEEAARLEREDSDMPLSVLQKWQSVLDVPISELLVESDEILSAPVLERARLLRVMKTAATILEKADSPRIRRLSETLVKQLVEIMPELEGIGPWHEYVGPRRRRDECGRTAERQVSPGLSRAIDSPDHAA